MLALHVSKLRSSWIHPSPGLALGQSLQQRTSCLSAVEALLNCPPQVESDLPQTNQYCAEDVGGEGGVGHRLG